MVQIWRNDRLFYSFLLLYAAVLATLALTTPLSPTEAELFYRQEWSPLVWGARLLHQWLPDALGLRALPLTLGLLNLYLFYSLLPDTFDRIEDRRFSLMIFALLPGVIAANVLLNEAVFALSLTLLFLWAYRRRIFWLEVLTLAAILSTTTASFALYIGAAIYAWVDRRRPLALIASALFIVSIISGRYLIGGHPQGHLPELFGIYAALFSPLFFVYYFYALYRVALEGPRDIYWSIAFSAMILSILLSIRQQVLIVDFSPYLLAGVMIPVSLYFRSMRVRMRRFQYRYRLAGAIVLASLLLSSLAVIVHRPLYEMLGRPHRFFAAPLYELSEKIERAKSEGKKCHQPVRHRYRALYRFYGIPPCKEHE